MSPIVFILATILGLSLGQKEDCLKPPANWPQKPPQCCELPFPIEGMKKQFGNCIQRMGQQPSSAVPTPKAIYDAQVCVEDCVYKGVGFKKGEKIEKEKIAEILKKGVAGKPQWSGPMDKAVQTCLADIGKRPAGKAACDNTPHDFTHCISRQLFLNCPSNVWKASNDCTIVKERMKVCPNLPPPPPLPPQNRPAQKRRQ